VRSTSPIIRNPTDTAVSRLPVTMTADTREIVDRHLDEPRARADCEQHYLRASVLPPTFMPLATCLAVSLRSSRYVNRRR